MRAELMKETMPFDLSDFDYDKEHFDNAEVEYQWFLIKNGLMKTIKHQDAMNKIAKISGLKSKYEDL